MALRKVIDQGFKVGGESKLALITLVAVPLSVLPIFGANRKQRALVRQAMDQMAKASSVASESLACVRAIKEYVREAHEHARYGVEIDRTNDLARRKVIAQSVLAILAGCNNDKVAEAARAANAEEFILALPSAYDEQLGERGTRLSGGQLQRIAISRAMLKDAPVLLLDEAMSSLDAANEHAVNNAIRTPMKGRTTLVIAHRLSTVVEADTIVVMAEGKVEATSTAVLHDLRHG